MKLALTPTTFAVVTLLSCLGSAVRCQTILVPSKLHIGENNTLLLISDADTSDATLTVSHKGQASALLSQQVQFRKGELVEWPLFLDAKTAFKEKVTLTLTFANGAKSTEEFEVSNSNGFIFFQTDKPIYRVSETVRFRILRLDRALSPVNETVVLKIQNHQKIKVEEVALQTKPPMHIAEHSFNFPLIAKPGTWIAEVHYGPKQKLVSTAKFDVTEYVLPLFKIDFTLPKYVLDTTSQINIGMNVTYMFGKPVRGTVHFRYGVMELEGKHSNFVTSSNTYCFDRGVMSHTADVGFIREFAKGGNVRFVVEAIVKECASGAIERSHDNGVLVVRRPYSISLRKTIRRYKKQVSNYITCEVLDPHGQPVANVPFTLSMTSKEKSPVELYPYIISSDTTASGPKNGSTDQNGQIIFLFKTSESTKSFEVRITTADPNLLDQQQAVSTFTIEPFDEAEKEYVWIESKNRLTFVVGDRFKSHIASGGMEGPFYLVVMSRGAIIHKEKLLSKQIDFELTNRMVPSVRLLLLAFTGKTGAYVADSVRLSVQAGTCGVDVSLEPKYKRILPGGKVNFKIRGHPSDVVGFHAIDEAVYALRSSKNSSRSQYKQSLEQSDAGCGPGGGGNSLEVIRSAGFKALTPNSENKFSDGICKLLARKKRVVPQKMSEIEKRKCCELANMKFAVKQSCEAKRKIVAKYKGEDCAREFLRCCQKSYKPVFQASASTANPDKPLSKHGSMEPKEEEIESGGADAQMVRSDFRDTWLFDLILLNESEHNVAIATPHTITTWFVSTLSISRKEGFCLNSQHRVVTFKPFFIKVSFPQTIIEREQTEIVVTIFNYVPSRLMVRVNLKRVTGICSDWFGMPKAIKNVSVDGMSSSRTAFPIIPISKGVYQIEIEAKTKNYSDTVIKNLTVLPPGIEKEEQLSFDLDPLNRAKRAAKVVHEFFVDETTNASQRTEVRLRNKRNTGDWASSDEKVVPKTLHYVVTAFGERYTPQLSSVEELNDLIRKPKGCGEQNMYYMAFNLYSLMYLEKIGKLNEKTRKKGVEYLKRAMRNQLNFRKEDGSYSAFMKRPSSIWLTAFVAKVVCQAGPYLEPSLDYRVINTALLWLQKNQKAQGSWTEVYPVLHEKALGGVKGSLTLTAFVSTVFRECRRFLGQNDVSHMALAETAQKAEAYIVQQYEKEKTHLVYSQALVAYCLSFSEQPAAQKLKKQLTSLLIRHAEIDRERNFQFWKGDYPVETAAYALMAFIQAPDPNVDILDYIAIVNWLTNEQKRGTFDNTQDTIVALEALSKYNIRYRETETDSNRHQLHTKVMFDKRVKRSLVFHNANADILQTIQVDQNTSQIGFETTGNGLGKVNLLIIYNEYNQNSTCRFDLEVDVFEYTAPVNVNDNEFDLDSFFDDKDEKTQNMLKDLAVTNVHNKSKNKGRISGFPSGSGNTTLITECCMHSRLAKRSIVNYKTNFWTRMAESLRGGNGKPDTGSNSHSKRSEPKPQSDQPKKKSNKQFKLGPLPNMLQLTELQNPIVLVLNICARHSYSGGEWSESGEYLTEMAILEVSILSGYKPIDSDLKTLKEDASIYVEHYDVSDSKVTFYLRTVPHARVACFPFRIYQQHRVGKPQSALVRLYNYYEQEWMCSRVYSSVRHTDYIQLQCNENDNQPDMNNCKCVTGSKCPGTEALDNILKFDDWDAALKNAEFLFCQYSNVLNGTVESVKFVVDKAGYESPMVQIRVDEEIRGETVNSSINLYYNPECNKSMLPEVGKAVILMHSPERDSKWLADGSTILKTLDAKSTNTLDTYVYASRKKAFSC